MAPFTSVAVPRDDRQEHEKILHLRGAGARRQERQEEIPCFKLSVDHEGEGECGMCNFRTHLFISLRLPQVKPFICTMPMRLDDGWNQIQFNLADFTRRAYGTNYVETLRVQASILHVTLELLSQNWIELFDPRLQIHANCRIRRVYFSDRLYSEEELPAEFKLYLPVQVDNHLLLKRLKSIPLLLIPYLM